MSHPVIDFSKYLKGNEELPTVVGPANETPVKIGTGTDGKKYGYYKSTGQWMQIPSQK